MSDRNREEITRSIVPKIQFSKDYLECSFTKGDSWPNTGHGELEFVDVSHGFAL